MYVPSLLLAIATISAVSALPQTARSPYAVKERHAVPRPWTRIGKASKGDGIHLSIGLRQSNQGEVERHLLEVSDPAHNRYGQHLSHAEIEDIIRPSEESQELVKAWLEEHGITNVVHNSAKDMVHVLIPIEQAEQLLQTSYSTYQHEDGSTINRASEWSLPLHLHDHIDVVQPTTSFFRPNPKYYGGPVLDEEKWALDSPFIKQQAALRSEAAPISQVCNASFVTPECLRTVYGTIDYTPQVPNKNGLAHTNYLNQTSYRKDIFAFLKQFRPEAANAANTFKNFVIANANNDQGPYTPDQLAAGKNLEALLDSTQMLSIAFPTKFSTYSTGGSPPFKPDLSTPTNTNEPYQVWLDFVLNQKSLPQVFSTSYGDTEQTVPQSYAKRVCQGFAQLGARGISVLFSSGDSGVGANGTCFSNDGKNTSMFLPAFPASCPWVTAVGGTANFEPEVAVIRFASGAGFSNYFPAPAYGRKTWNAYIASLNGLYNGLYNKAGRAYPDVAAQGNRDAVVYNNMVRTIGGTSASSPTFAAVISLVNDALIAKGRPPLGFLNPWLYAGAYKALTDVTIGTSYGCDTNGFPARKGWDAVTGFGTPNFKKLVAAAFLKPSKPTKLPGYGSGGH